LEVTNSAVRVHRVNFLPIARVGIFPDVDSDTEASRAQWTIGHLLRWTRDYLDRHGVDEPRLAAEVLLSRAAGYARIELYTHFDQELDEARLNRFRDWVGRAAKHEPIAYLVEEKEFFSLPFRVTPEVLIPRPETELLVECVLDHCTKISLAEPRLLDLGTGSGCIAVALLAQCAGAVAVATDVSSAALEVARCNAERNGVSDRLTLVEADRLALPNSVVPDEGFDVLVSNPPYVAADGMDQLETSVRRHEPRIALTDGQDGLTFYRSIATDGAALLSARGVVLVEVGDGQAAVVVETVDRPGELVHRGTWKDRVVGQPRVLMFSRASGAWPSGR